MSLGKSINGHLTEKLFCLQFYYNSDLKFINSDVDGTVSEVLVNPMSFGDIGDTLSDASWF